MAIVKMKRLRLLAMHTEREELLQRLQTLGCVEVDEPEIDLSDPDWSALARPDGAGLARARDESARLNGALVILDRYAPEKKSLFHPRPMIGTKELFDDEAYRAALDTADQVAEEEPTAQHPSGRAGTYFKPAGGFETLGCSGCSPGTGRGQNAIGAVRHHPRPGGLCRHGGRGERQH